MTRIQEITITKVPAIKGGSQISWNVDLNGVPFGQIWTFKAFPGEVHCYHAKTLAGAYADFATYKAAETFMRSKM